MDEIQSAVAAEREACAKLVEDLVLRFTTHNPLLPPPYPRSYLFKAAHEIRMRDPVYAAQASAQN